MTPEQLQLVQASWARIKPLAPQAAELFYARLFTLDPSLRVLFKNDMEAQGAKLMQTINLVVNSLDKLDSLLPALQAMGQRHAGYGVQASHYDTVGAALLWTLEQSLEPAFTPAIHTAWAEAYSTLAGVMKNACEIEVTA